MKQTLRLSTEEKTNSNRKPARDGAAEDRENTTKYSEQNGNPEKQSVAVQGRRHKACVCCVLRGGWICQEDVRKVIINVQSGSNI